MRGTHSRLAHYHMSKQNPELLLDPVFSPSPQATPPPRGTSLLTSPVYNAVRSGSSPVGVSFQMSRTPTPVSLLRQSLRANKTHSAQSSLVQLATQRAVRPTGLSASISPVIVRLSPTNTRLTRGNPSGTRATNQETVSDPCGKETVLTALRNKR